MQVLVPNILIKVPIVKIVGKWFLPWQHPSWKINSSLSSHWSETQLTVFQNNFLDLQFLEYLVIWGKKFFKGA